MPRRTASPATAAEPSRKRVVKSLANGLGGKRPALRQRHQCRSTSPKAQSAQQRTEKESRAAPQRAKWGTAEETQSSGGNQHQPSVADTQSAVARSTTSPVGGTSLEHWEAVSSRGDIWSQQFEHIFQPDMHVSNLTHQ